MSSYLKRFTDLYKSPPEPTPEKPEERAFGIYDMSDTPEYRVRMPLWMYTPPKGFARLMRNGEIFNANEMRLLGNSSSAWTCKKKIGDDVVSAPWDILPVDPDHPNQEKKKEIKYFLQHGRRIGDQRLQYSSETFNHVIFATVMDILDFDAGVIVKVFGKVLKNRLLQIQSRDGSTILKEVDKYGILQRFWQYDYKHMEAIDLTPREIMYIIQSPQSDSPYGTSPLETIRMVIRSLVKGVETKELIHRKGGIPSGIMSLEGMNKIDFEAFKRWWRTKLKTKVYKTAMVNVKANWVPLITSFKDLEFLETQKWFTELVYRTYKVPHYGLGTGAREVKGAMPERRKVYLKDAIYPILTTLEQRINNEIIPHFYDEGEEPDCRFHYPVIDILEQTEEFELWIKKFEWGTARINDYRREKGLEPLAWGELNPMALKEIQQICQSWFYGALDTASLNKITGLEVPKVAEALREKTAVAKVPPPTETGT